MSLSSFVSLNFRHIFLRWRAHWWQMILKQFSPDSKRSFREAFAVSAQTVATKIFRFWCKTKTDSEWHMGELSQEGEATHICLSTAAAPSPDLQVWNITVCAFLSLPMPSFSLEEVPAVVSQWLMCSQVIHMYEWVLLMRCFLPPAFYALDSGFFFYGPTDNGKKGRVI